MRHPSDGTLRRLLDEPDGVARTDREHVTDCPLCQTALAVTRSDATFAAVALSPAVDEAADAVGDPGLDAAWRRLTVALDHPAAGRAGSDRGGRNRRWRTALRSPIVVATGVVAVLLAGAGVATATDWLPIFHVERVAPITAPQAELVALPDLSDFGTLAVTEPVRLRQVAGAADAERVTGLAVPKVARLPRGVTGSPAYHVGDRASAEYTFSAAKAAQTAARLGKTLPPPPAGLDGSRFRLVAGPGLAAIWTSGAGAPGLVVARAVAPVAYSQGVAFETVRDYLLPILPPDLARQLGAFTGDRTSTLPLVVAGDRMASSPAQIGGAPATVLTRRDGTFAAVVWVDDTGVVGVAGPLSADEVLSVARDLRWGR
jgi:hypothetical protein